MNLDSLFPIGTTNALAENNPLVLPSTLSAPSKYAGIVEIGTAGEPIAFGELNYLKSSDARWWRTLNSSQSTAGSVRLGMCVVAGSTGGTVTNLVFGKVKSGSFDLTVGAPAYVGASAGAITKTLPSTNGATIRVIGFGAGTTNELFFNPSNDYLVYQA